MIAMFLALILALAVPCVAQSNGGRGTDPPAACVAGDFFVRTGGSPAPCVCGSTNNWTCMTGGGESVPSGAILLIKTGTCPTGYVEDSDLNGRTVIGTLAANGNVGTTGGADNITPAGNNSGGAVSAHAGTAVADHASHTHTYTQVPNHVHVERVQGGTTASITGTHIMTSAAAGGSLRSAATSTLDPTGGVATGTTNGPGATLTHSVTQPSAHTFTNPAFTGTQFDNRSAFARVIFCRKT